LPRAVVVISFAGCFFLILFGLTHLLVLATSYTSGLAGNNEAIGLGWFIVALTTLVQIIFYGSTKTIQDWSAFFLLFLPPITQALVAWFLWNYPKLDWFVLFPSFSFVLGFLLVVCLHFCESDILGEFPNYETFRMQLISDSTVFKIFSEVGDELSRLALSRELGREAEDVEDVDMNY